MVFAKKCKKLRYLFVHFGKSSIYVRGNDGMHCRKWCQQL
jgi:hypothetical protein